MYSLVTVPRKTWSLFDELESFDDDVSRVLTGRPVCRSGRRAGLAAFTPRVDVSETDTEVTVAAELPGLDEKDITVEMEDGYLSIRGERKDEKEDKGRNWYRKERSYGTFHRAIALPAEVDGEKAKAKFAKGILTITMPKREEEQSKRKTIAIESD